MAAQRAGIKTVIVPAACEADILHNVRIPYFAYAHKIQLLIIEGVSQQVSASVKEGMDIKYAEDVRQVLKIAFADDPSLVERIDKLPVSQRQER